MNKHSFSFASYLIVALVSISILSACGNKKPYADSPIVGRWYMEQPMISDGIDYSAGWFAAHDSFAYDFEEDGSLIISGGPQPLDPVKYNFELLGDTVLNITAAEQHTSFVDKFKVMSITSDTIWLHPIETEAYPCDYCFLVKK